MGDRARVLRDVRRSAGTLATALVAFAVLCVVMVLQGPVQWEDRRIPAPEPETGQPTISLEPTATSTATPTEVPEVYASPDNGLDRLLAWILLIVVVALVIFLLRNKLRQWGAALAELLPEHLRRTPRLPVGAATAVTLPTVRLQDEVAAEQVVGAAEDAYAILVRTSDPTEAIMAAWVAFEQAVAHAGPVRGEAETPAEFVVRIVGMREGARAETTALLGLYEDVRFGGITATDPDRELAKSALTVIAQAWR